ncbi:MAG: hypothetical protein AB1757_07400 [Acidobacteriota bacterium]
MKITQSNLPKTERYPCSRRSIKDMFDSDGVSSATFGWPSKKYTFDSRCFNQPNVTGTVIASVTFNRDRVTSLRLFSVKREKYSEEAEKQFIEEILPRLRKWVAEQQQKSDTAIIGVEECVVELAGERYRLHELRYL